MSTEGDKNKTKNETNKMKGKSKKQPMYYERYQVPVTQHEKNSLEKQKKYRVAC